MKKRFQLIALLAVALLGACSGNVIINGTKLASSFRSGSRTGYNLNNDFRLGNRYTWIDPETGLNLASSSTAVLNLIAVVFLTGNLFQRYRVGGITVKLILIDIDSDAGNAASDEVSG